MKVLYFSDNCSDHNRCFLQKLAEAGVEAWFLDPTSDCLPEEWLPKGVRWIQPRKKLKRDVRPQEFEEFLPEFRGLISSIAPDIVHAGPTHSAGYLAALSGFHPWLLATWGWDVLYQPDQGMEWRKATEAAVAGADGFLFDCDAVRTKVREFVNVADEQIVQFPWGIEKGAFSPDGERVSAEKFTRESGTTVFICTRSWEPIYAVDVLVDAFRIASRIEPSLRLLLLGGGSQERQVREFIRNHDLQRLILTPGTVGRAEVPKWFRIADVYISCSKTDSTSISLLEAMANGLPVVVTNIASNREWVTEGHNGWLAESSSAEDFADRILRAARLSPEERHAISVRNQRIVSDRANWDRNFPRLLEMYQRLVARPVSREKLCFDKVNPMRQYRVK